MEGMALNKMEKEEKKRKEKLEFRSKNILWGCSGDQGQKKK